MKFMSIVTALPVLLFASHSRAELTAAFQSGFKITWTLLAEVKKADKLAACSIPRREDSIGTLYALHKAVGSTRPLYKSTDDGKTWTFIRSLPSTVTSISCGFGQSVVALEGLTKTLTRYSGAQLETAAQLGEPQPNLLSIQSGGTFALGVDFDGTVRYLGQSTGGTPSWATYGVAPAASAAMITVNRFALSDNRTLHFGSFDQWNNWTRITSVIPEDYLTQISGARGSILYALQAAPGSPRKLYRADFTELNCTDNYDTDQDGYPDWQDPDCT
jgi:hypothetical protein